MNKILLIFLCALMTFFVFYPPIEGRQYWIALIGTSFLFLVLSLELCKKIHWSVGLFVLFALISGFKEFFLPTMYPIPVNQVNIAKGGAEILWACVSILIFSILVLIKNKKFFEAVYLIICLSAILDSILIIISYFFFNRNYGMLSNSTADATFIVCFLPPLFKIHKDNIGKITNSLIIFLFLSAILITKSNTAFAGIGIGFAFYTLQKWPIKKWLLTMPLATLLVAGSAKLFLGQKLMNDSGRYSVWKLTLSFFNAFANKWIGFGTGTFTVWGDAAQRVAHMNEKTFTLWIWLHNIILEVMFENGFIGVILMLIVYGFMLTKLFKDKTNNLFSVAVVYGFTALLEMPERIWVTQLLGVTLLAIAFKKDELAA